MKEIKHEDVHLGKKCPYCQGKTIVERFTLFEDEDGMFHVTNDFKCQNCLHPIIPNAKNNLKTFENRENIKKFLISFTPKLVLREIVNVEVYCKSSTKVRGFAEKQLVFTESLLNQYTLDLDGFKNDDNFITIFTFDQYYNPTPFSVPRDAIIAQNSQSKA